MNNQRNPNNRNLHVVNNQRHQDDEDDYTPPQRNTQRNTQRPPARRSAGMDALTVFLLLMLTFLVSLFFLSPYLGGPQ